MTTQTLPIIDAGLSETESPRRGFSFRVHSLAPGLRGLRKSRPHDQATAGALDEAGGDLDTYWAGEASGADAIGRDVATAACALTDDGRAEFLALRGEIIERLRAQQQGMQFTLMLLTAVLAGAATLPGRVSEESIFGFLQVTAMLPVTLLALLFAGLSAVFAEQEVMISYAGGYIAKRLRMPWEFTRHGTLGFKRRAVVRVQAWTMLGAKYLLAAVPAVLLWGISAIGLGNGTGVWGASASPFVVWVSTALWVLVGAVLLASAAGVIVAILSYRSIHALERAARTQGTAGRHALVTVLRQVS